MTENDNTRAAAEADQLLDAFFAPARQMEVADDGFTEKVMGRLPDREQRWSRLWTLFCVAVFAALLVFWYGLDTIMADLAAFISTAPVTVNPVALAVTLATMWIVAISEIVQRERLV